MKRREFIALLGGSAVAWPLAARGQRSVVDFLYPGSPGANAAIVSAFRDGLAETGYVEGRNVAATCRCTRSAANSGMPRRRGGQ